MSKKAEKSLKIDLLLEERERLLEEVGKLDAVLNGKSDAEEATALLKRAAKWFSLKECVNWLQQFIERDLSDVQSRLDDFVDALEREFPGPDDPYELFQQGPDGMLERAKVRAIVQLFIDSSLTLYAFGRYGAAIIDLHGSLERQALERLARLILLPEKVEFGIKVIERRTLPELASALRDCGVLDKNNVKFAQRLNKIRNGLAHKNAKVISNALLSGREILEAEIDSVVSGADYILFAIGAIRLFIKTLEWYEETE